MIKEILVTVTCLAIIAAIAFVMFRGAKKMRAKYKAQGHKPLAEQKLPKSAVQAMLGLFWAATIYHLKANMGLGYEIALPLVTALAIGAYYALKKGIIEGEGKE